MADTDRAELLQTLMKNPGAANDMLRKLLEERAAGDPAMAHVLALLEARQAAAAVTDDDEDDEPDAPSPSDSIELRRLRKTVAEMQHDLDELYERNDEFARAVGACAACWGDDRQCEDCNGRGKPAWRKPDARLFKRLVAPAQKRLEEPPTDDPANRRKR